MNREELILTALANLKPIPIPCDMAIWEFFLQEQAKELKTNQGPRFEYDEATNSFKEEMHPDRK